MPSFTHRSRGEYLTYSQKHGLISIGGQSDNIPFALLKFNHKNNSKSLANWNWKHININLENARFWLSATMISDDKLIICGGYGCEYKTDIYDFNQKTKINVAKMNYKRKSSGIYFDKNNNVYIVGGNAQRYSSINSTFESYDITKNAWITLSSTNKNHILWPALWSNEPNILYIASTYRTMTVEKFDIRENKWHIDKINNTETFDELFQTKMKYDYQESRLLLPCNF